MNEVKRRQFQGGERVIKHEVVGATARQFSNTQRTRANNAPSRKSASNTASKPTVSLHKFRVLALTHFLICEDPKLKGLVSHSKKQFDNYLSEIRKNFKQKDIFEALQDLENNQERYMPRAMQRIERYKFRKTFVTVRNTAAAVAIGVAITIASLTGGNSNETQTEDINPPSYTYEDSKRGQDIEYDIMDEVQPQLSQKEFTQQYQQQAREQALRADETISFMEDTQKSGHQTVAHLDGMSIGQYQWNFSAGAQTANDLLKTFIKNHHDSALSVFGSNGLASLETVLKKTPAEIEEYMTKNFDYWQPIFRDKLLVNEDFVSLMEKDKASRQRQAHTICDDYDLTSALAFEFALNGVTLNGHTGTRNNFAVLDTIDREKLTPEFARKYLVDKFTTQASSRPDQRQFLNEKLEVINNLSDAAVLDYYLLNCIVDQHSQNAAKRSRGILGEGGRTVGGVYEHGYEVHPGRFFTTDLSKLEETRKPETEKGLAQSLFDAGYGLDDTATTNRTAQAPTLTPTPAQDRGAGQ